MSKYIKASIRYEAMAQIDDNQGLFRLAEAVPMMKEKLLRELKQNIIKRTENLTVDNLTYEEVIMPDLKKEEE
jgi:hypothetical protein